MMYPSVSTWSAHHLLETNELDAGSFLDLVKKNRISSIEIVDIDFSEPSPASMQEFQRDAEKRGITVSCMSLEHDLCRVDPDERKADVEKVKRWMKISRDLGVRNVRAFTGWHKPCLPYPMQLEWVYEGLSRIAEEAEKMDLDIVLENHDDVCLGADEILAMFKRIGSKHLFTCPDLFNYKTLKGDTIPVIGEWSFTEIAKLLPFARNAHLKICEATENNTNDKYLDTKRVISQMRDAGYQGPVALEFMWPYLTAEKNEAGELEKAMRVLVNNL